MFPEDDRTHLRREWLQRMRYAVMTYVARDFANVRVDASEHLAPAEVAANMLAVRLTADIYGKDGESVTVEYPSTWWDAFKQRWLPGRPFRLTRVTLTPRSLFPQFRPAELGREVSIVVAERSQRDGWTS